jgi:hypothetical protein
MNWSNLLSGVIGALLGGLLAIVASLMSASIVHNSVAEIED